MFAGVYWGSRLESRTAAARRIVTFLEKVKPISDEFAQWYLLEEGPEDVRRPIDTSDASVVAAELTAIGKGTRFQLGYSFGVWNGDDAQLLAAIGGRQRNPPNRAVLSHGGEGGHHLTRAQWRAILGVAIAVFEPATGGVAGERQLREATGAQTILDFGWLTYRKGKKPVEHDERFGE